MDKMSNVDSNKIYGEIAPSYEELISFSIKDLEKLPQSSLNCGEFKERYNLRIKLFGGSNFFNEMVNSLVLDNTTSKYSYVFNTGTLNSEAFNPQFNIDSLFTEVFVNNSSKILNLDLIENLNSRVNESHYLNSRSGFTLSNVIENIGDFNKLIQRDKNFNGDVLLDQKAYVLNRCGKCYLICNFNLSNKGNAIAQKIIFKNVFPSNVIVNSENVFVNGIRVCEKNVFLNRNSLLLRLGDLDKEKELNVTVVCRLCCFSNKINFCTISYVNNCFKDRNKMFLDISQKISNGKRI